MQINNVTEGAKLCPCEAEEVTSLPAGEEGLQSDERGDKVTRLKGSIVIRIWRFINKAWIWLQMFIV